MEAFRKPPCAAADGRTQVVDIYLVCLIAKLICKFFSIQSEISGDGVTSRLAITQVESFHIILMIVFVTVGIVIVIVKILNI